MNLAGLVLFFFAFSIHEFAHGWVANKLGDPTAKYSGRLTINPLKHIDPVGTIIIPLVLILSGSAFVFGWAKPVPINFTRLRHPKTDIIWVGLAGPLANIILALFIGIILKLGIAGGGEIYLLLQTLGIANLVLAVFNLIPVPPLDGSRVILGLLPNKYAFKYAKLEPYGIIILVGLLFFGFLRTVIWPIVLLLAHLFGIV